MLYELYMVSAADMQAVHCMQLPRLRQVGLQKATMYVTSEPCAMCAGANLIIQVGTAVYGARSTLLGADGSWMQISLPCAAALDEMVRKHS